MTTEVVTVREDTTLEDIVALLTQHRISSVPVVDETGRVLGIVGEGDLFLKEKGIPFSMVKAPALFNQWADADRVSELHDRTRRHTARDVMTCPAICADENDDIAQIVRLMRARGLHHIPIVRDGHLCGIIARADLIRLLAGDVKHPPVSEEDDPFEAPRP